MTEHVPAALRGLVRDRANGRCEYCLIHEDDSALPHQPDHVVAVKHGGVTTADNLALACFLCNRFKGSDVASIDPQTGAVVRLFRPRADRWSDHFLFAVGVISGRTPEGRATARLLRFNARQSVETRRNLFDEGRWPAP